MKKILIIFFAFFISNCYADSLVDCIKIIEGDTASWETKLNGDIFKKLGNSDPVTNDIVQKEKSKIYKLLADNVLSHCKEDLADISRQARGLITFKHDTNNYGFDFSVETLFDYMDITTEILVLQKKDLSPGDVFKVSDIRTKDHFFSDECSDHIWWDNIDDDGAANIAGQAVFSEFGGKSNEFIIATYKDNVPGLVLVDDSAFYNPFIKYNPVFYKNVKKGVERAQQFAQKLTNTACSRDGLAVYLVTLEPISNNDFEITVIDGPNIP